MENLTVKKTMSMDLSHNDKVVVVDSTPFINIKSGTKGRVINKLDQDADHMSLSSYVNTFHLANENNKSDNVALHRTMVEFFDEENKVYVLQVVTKGKEHLFLIRDDF